MLEVTQLQTTSSIVYCLDLLYIIQAQEHLFFLLYILNRLTKSENQFSSVLFLLKASEYQL